MNLTSKLGKIWKSLALMGALASPVYNSGCLELAVVGAGKMIADSNRDAAEIEAQGRRDAARIQTGNNNRCLIPKVNEFFTCNYFKGDLNRDGIAQSSEYEGYGRESFPISERISIVFSIQHPLDRWKVVNFSIYEKPDNRLVYNGKFSTEREIANIHELKGPEKKPGDYFAEWEINNNTIGVVDFEIKENALLHNFVPYLPQSN